MDILEQLAAHADEGYADFQSKLTPAVPREKFIGVRVPDVRKLAKKIVKEGEYQPFLKVLPHKYFDENMLHGLIISEIKDYDECRSYLEDFLPFVDNWAVCDSMSPKCFKKNKEDLLVEIKKWAASDKVYTCRFGMEMLMTHFLDEDFKAEYLKIPASVHLDDYYAKMMIAWFFATALTKQWEFAVLYLEDNVLEPWTHNKTIQKARESFRIPEERKNYLNTLKR